MMIRVTTARFARFGVVACFFLSVVSTFAALKHRYSFTSGAADTVGSAHGTLIGSAAVTNGLLVLDGAGAYVNLPNNIVTGYTAITVETWITDDGSGTWARIYDFGNNNLGEDVAGTGTQYMFLSLPAGGGVLRSAYTLSGGASEQRVSVTRPPVGEKTHIVWTSDGATQTGALYVNGILAGSNSGMSLTPNDLGPTVNNWIGRSQFSADPYFRGSIDEFRIYNVALSSQAISNHHLAGPDVVLEGPVYIAMHPGSTTAVAGEAVTFSAAVGGTWPHSLRWYRNGAPIPGATNSTYSFTASNSDNNAVFMLWATNVFGGTNCTASSSNAVLTVIPDTIAPVLLRAQSASTNGVEVWFSERIRADTATNLANFSLSGPSGTVPILAAVADTNGTLITLSTPALMLGGTYTLMVSNVCDLAGNPVASGTQKTFVATVYLVRDVGSPDLIGAIVPASSGFGFAAAGAGIGGTSDQFTFAYETRTGDFDLQVRIGSLELSDPWACVGLMARDGSASNAVFAATLATPGPSGTFFQSRAAVGENATRTGSFPVNYPHTWLRLKRAGNVFTGYASLDGLTWSLLGSRTITVSTALQVGIAATSQSAAQPTLAIIASAGTVASTSVGSVPLPFEPPGPSSRRTGLVISEIMYNPANVGSNTLEFVELYNSDLIAEDLSGYRISGDIDFRFPSGTILPSGGYIVIARYPADVASYYGISNVLGPFTNNLPNSSGTVRVRNELDNVLLEVDYGSKAPWPAAADGAGHSLVLRRPSYGENDVRAWGASDLVGGSPGRADGYGPEPLRGIVINEFTAHTDLPEVDTIELFNTSSTPVNLLGCVLTDNASTNKYVIGNVTIPPRGFIYFTETQLGFALDAAGERIFLKNPDGTRVLDAVRFEAQENGVSFGRFPDGSHRWSRLSARTFGSANATPRISQVGFNEIMYHPISGDDDLQYVEIYNRGPGSVNLSGWKLEDGISFAFPSNTTLAANAYLVVAKNVSRLLTNYPGLNAGNTIGNFSGRLARSGERLALTMPDTIVSTNSSGVVSTNRIDIVVDEFTYSDGGRWGQWADGGGSSLELIDPRGDKRDASNWADSDETAKAPWTLIERTALTGLGMPSSANSAPNRLQIFLQGAGECLVDSVEVRSNGGSNRVSNSGFESGTTGWTFQGTHEDTIVQTGGAYSGSGAMRIRATGRGDTGANRIRTSVSTLPVDGTNEVTLRARVRWLKGDPNILLRIRGNWIECAGVMTLPTNLGTPGAPNSRLVANAGPAISDVGHFPVLPAATEPVLVTARINDPDNVGTATLYYRVDPGTTYTGITMRDDGTGGDRFANDGIYSATVPGQSANTRVAFYIQASDAHASAAATLFPADPPKRECLINFGESLPTGSIGSYRLWLTSSNLTYWANREKNSNKGIDATFVYGNWRVVYNVETLYSGSPFHTLHGGYNGPLGNICNYDVRFPKDDLLLGADEFTLQGQNAAESAIFNPDATAQAEATAHWMARKIGLRPNHRRHVFVSLNGVARGMIYHDAQQPNGHLLDGFFPNDPDGYLHKIEDWFEFADDGFNFNYITARLLDYTLQGEKSVARYRWNFRPRAVAGSPNDFTHLFALADAVSTATPGPEPYTSATLSLMNVPQWMRVFALQHMAGNWDCYGYRRGKNMYMYKPLNGRWELLLWDVQLVFGKSSDGTTHNLFDLGNPSSTAEYEPVIARMYGHAPFVREFWAALEELVNGPMLPANYNTIMDARFNALRAHGLPVQDPAGLKNWINARRSYIISQLPAASFTVSGATSFSSATNRVTFSGTAPLSAGSILVNGAAYPITWTSVTAWTVTVPLGAGTNTLSIQAIDRNGNVVGTASRTVNYTGSVPPAEGAVVFNEILYKPSIPGAEFVELFNTSSNFTFDLSGWRINGLGYTFPAGAVMSPRSFLVLAKDPYVFALVYGSTNVPFGQFDGNLDPDGEVLSLLQPGTEPGEELVVDRVRYEPGLPWPGGTNGASLQLIDALQDNSRPGNWAVRQTAPFATPGATNSVAAAMSPFAPVWLNELQADNLSGPADNFGQREPWVEIFNAGTNAVSLSGYYLSDSYTNLAKWPFPSWASVPAKGFLLVWCDNETAQTATGWPHANFRLSSVSGRVALSRQISGTNQIVDYLTYTNLTQNWSYGDTPDGQPFYRNRMVFTTPGGTNNHASAPVTIYINEWLADNVATLRDPADNQFEDWFELYNPGTNVVDLGGFYLSDTLTNKTQFQIPNNGHYVVPPGGYLLVWADNEPGQNNTNRADLHANFALAKGGEALGLFAPDGTVIDAVTFGPQTTDVSQGRYPSGGAHLFFMTTPTPRTNNIIPNTAPVLSAIGDKFVHAGQTLQFTATASDAEEAVQTFTFALSNAPAGATIHSSSGFFSWTVSGVPVPSTNTVTIRVTDDGTPPLSGSQTFAVVVHAPPNFSQIARNGDGTVGLTFGTLPGQYYQLEYKNNLGDPEWAPVGAPIFGDGTTVQVNVTAGTPQRFYRLAVLP